MAKILILGVTGMLGNALFRVFSSDTTHKTWGTLRSNTGLQHFPDNYHKRLITGVDVLDQDILTCTLDKIHPDVVINCVGLIKQLAEAKDPLSALPINSMLPHRLARLCSLAKARLIHISTDCVFSGSKGGYLESDRSDADDLYGKSKYIGELHDLPHAITLRTSIIGHELSSNSSLVDWFLSQEGDVKGFSRAIFSGVPTVELARVIKDFVLPHSELSGLYHIAAAPIAKLDLLKLIAAQYGKKIDIHPDDTLIIDRSLDGSQFAHATGYNAPSWPVLIERMHTER